MFSYEIEAAEATQTPGRCQRNLREVNKTAISDGRPVSGTVM
jgi:hypothetical protein